MKRKNVPLSHWSWRILFFLNSAVLSLIFTMQINVQAADQDLSKIWLIDFGSSHMTAADGWNNVTENLGSDAGAQLPNLVNAKNEATHLNLEILSRFNGANTNGTINSDHFTASATTDSLYGNTKNWFGLSDVKPSFKLTSLDPARKYRFIFYASRLGVNDVRETSYTVIGKNTTVVTLDPANNIYNMAATEEEGISPDDMNEITIKLAPTVNNSNGYHFTYLGALQIVEIAPENVDGDKPPSAPSHLVSTAQTDTSVTLSWQASQDDHGVTGYDIFQDDRHALTVGGTTTTCTVADLFADTAYTFSVRAKDAAGHESLQSNVLTVTTNTVVEDGTEVAGEITTNTTFTKGNSPYYITGDVWVKHGARLTINPGVKVIFKGHYRMTINGSIEAKGTQTERIVFTTTEENKEQGWHGIRIWGGDPYDKKDNNNYVSPDLVDQYIEYCLFEYASKDYKMDQGDDYINDSHYSETRGSALFLDYSDPQQRELKIQAALLVHINHNIFRNNRTKDGGAALHLSSLLGNWTMTGNEFYNNNAQFGGAITYQHSGILTLKNCVFEDNHITHVPNATYSFEGGGAIYTIDPIIYIDHCSFLNNTRGDYRENNFGRWQGGGQYSEIKPEKISFVGNDSGSCYYFF